MAIDFKSIFSSQFFTRFQFDILRRLAGEVQANIDWDAILNKPVVFPPGPHTHDAADIVSGQFDNARISQSSVAQHQAALSIAWSQLTSKPTTLAGYGITDAVDNFSAQSVGGLKTFTFGAIRVQGWGSDPTSGIVYLGDAATDAYVYRPGGTQSLIFKYGTGSATLNTTGTILTTTSTSGPFVLKAGDTMTGALTSTSAIALDYQRANGRMFIRDNGSGFPTIDFVNPANSAFAVGRFTGAGFAFNGGPVDANAGLRAYNAGQVRVYDSNNDTPIELGLGFGSGTDRNGYLWNRNNGFLSLGTNNLERVRILAAGQTLFRLDMRHYVGSVSTQSVMRYLGWNNEVPRWAEVVEADATYSLYNYSTSGASADRIFNLIGANMGTKRIISYGEVAQQASNNAFRTVVGNYGAFWHMNTTDFYLMFTASGDQYGSFNSLRPIQVNITTGQVTIGHVVSMISDAYVSGRFYPAAHVAAQGTALVLSAVNNPGSFVYVRPNGADNSAGQTQWNAAGEMFTSHAIHSGGASAALFFQNRSGSQDWAWYCNGNVTYLWNGSTNIMSTDSSGNFSANNWTATSDRRLKIDDGKVELYEQLAELTIHDFRWKKTGERGRGPMAQDVQRIAPAYVFERNGILSIDKGGLALEVALLALRLALQRKQA